MPPAQLLYEHISIQQHLPNETGVVPSDLIILYSLVLTVILFVKLMQKLIKGPKLDMFRTWALSSPEELSGLQAHQVPLQDPSHYRLRRLLLADVLAGS